MHSLYSTYRYIIICLCVCYARASVCECFYGSSATIRYYVRSMFWKKRVTLQQNCTRCIANESCKKRDSHYCIALKPHPPPEIVAGCETSFALLHLPFYTLSLLSFSLSCTLFSVHIHFECSRLVTSIRSAGLTCQPLYFLGNRRL